MDLHSQVRNEKLKSFRMPRYVWNRLVSLFFWMLFRTFFFMFFLMVFFCFHDGVSMFSSGWSWCRKAYIHAAPNAGSAPMTAGGPGTMCDRFDREIQIVYFDTVCCSIIYFPTCQVRVVRFYQSCSSPPRLALRKVIWDILKNIAGDVFTCQTDLSEPTGDPRKGAPVIHFRANLRKQLLNRKKAMMGWPETMITMYQWLFYYPAWFLRLQFAKWKNPPCYSWVHPVFLWP